MQAQAYPDADCSDPINYGYCQDYYTLYGYPSLYPYSNPYGLIVVPGVGGAFLHHHGLFTTAVSTEVSGAADYTAATANFKIWNDLGSQSASLDPRAPTVRARIKPVL